MNQRIWLAKSAVENYIENKKIITPPKNLPEEFLTKKSGVFVTVEKQGQLQGCIGTYLPTKKNIAQEIIHNAIAAVTEDYRFTPIQKPELAQLSYTVYILSKPKLVKNIKNLDPKKYGIITKTVSSKSGLLLPGLEGIDTVEQQISITCQKAGINPNTEKLVIYKFTVKKYT